MSFLLAPLASGTDPLHHVVDHIFAEGSLLHTLGVTKHVIFLWIAAGLCLCIFPLIVRRIQKDGTGGRLAGFFEFLLIRLIRDEITRPFMGKDGDRFLPIIWTFFFFILFCNLLGMLPFGATATANLGVTAGLAIASLVFYHSVGIRRNGFVPYWKANLLVGPPALWVMMAPIEIMGHVIKPCALAIRLFANMVAGHVMLGVFFMFCVMAVESGSAIVGTTIPLVAMLAAIAISFFEIFVAFLQAYTLHPHQYPISTIHYPLSTIQYSIFNIRYPLSTCLLSTNIYHHAVGGSDALGRVRLGCGCPDPYHDLLNAGRHHDHVGSRRRCGILNAEAVLHHEERIGVGSPRDRGRGGRAAYYLQRQVSLLLFGGHVNDEACRSRNERDGR